MFFTMYYPPINRLIYLMIKLTTIYLKKYFFFLLNTINIINFNNYFCLLSKNYNFNNIQKLFNVNDCFILLFLFFYKISLKSI